MLDVFFYEAFEEEAEMLRRLLPPGLQAGFTPRTIQEEGHAEPPARIVSIRTQSDVPADWAPRIAALLARTTGYDHVRAYRAKAGRPVAAGHLPKYCARAVAEQAMLLWMALLRRLPAQVRQFERFDRDGLTGRECEQKTLLVVGVGNIGWEAVRIGRGLGMTVLGIDVVRRHAEVDYVAPEDGLAQADVIVCSMNLTPVNRGYFAYDRLKGVKKGAVLVNVARGEMSPAADLLRALDEGLLAGVALDVYDNENALAVALRAGGPVRDAAGLALLELRGRPNVILTPHNAFNTVESVERKAEQTILQVRNFLDKGEFLWPVPEGSG